MTATWIRTILTVILGSGLFWTTASPAAMGDHLLVSTDATAMRSGPDASRATIAVLPRDSRLVELGRNGDWVHVSVKGTGAQGWVESVAVTPPPAPQPESVSNTPVAQPASPASTMSVSLAEAGYRTGFRFEGSDTVLRHLFKLPTPREGVLGAASFRLRYTTSAGDGLRLQAGGEGLPTISAAAQTATDQPQELLIPLAPALFRDGQVNVALEVTLPQSMTASTAPYLQVLPDSRLELTFNGAPTSVREAWQRLPWQVTVTIPEAMSEADFAAAWSLLDLLYREGRQVNLVRLPELGHLVIAPAAAIESATGVALPTDADSPALVTTLAHTFIAVTGAPANLLAARRPPLAPNHNPILFPVGPTTTPPDAERYALPLELVGFDTGPRAPAGRIEWQASVAPRDLPPRTRPSQLNVRLAVPACSAAATLEFYAYLNDILVKAARLDRTGAIHTVTVPLPAHYQQQIDRLRLTVRDEGGACQGAGEGGPIQLLPEGTLLVERDDALPTRLTDIAGYLAEPFELVLARSFLQRPELLPLLARLGIDYPLAVNFGQLRFVDDGARFAPSRPFLAIGDFAIADVHMPVRFDQGALRVVDANEQPLLDVDMLPSLTVAQLVAGSGFRGLWIRPARNGELPTLGGLGLVLDDVAFVDASGIVFTISSRQPQLARVDYPDVETVIGWIAHSRFWLLGGAWFGLTLLGVYLLRMSMRHHTSARSIGSAARKQ